MLENEYDEYHIVWRRLIDGTWWVKNWAKTGKRVGISYFWGILSKWGRIAQFEEYETMKKRMEDGTLKVKMVDAWEKDGWSDESESSIHCSLDYEDHTQSDIDSDPSHCQVPAMAVD